MDRINLKNFALNMQANVASNMTATNILYLPENKLKQEEIIIEDRDSFLIDICETVRNALQLTKFLELTEKLKKGHVLGDIFWKDAGDSIPKAIWDIHLVISEKITDFLNPIKKNKYPEQELTYLQIAILENNLKLVELIIEHNRIEDIYTKKIHLPHRSKEYVKALEYAVQHLSIKEFVNAKEEISAVKIIDCLLDDKNSKVTAQSLFYALRTDNKHLAMRLLAKIAKEGAEIYRKELLHTLFIATSSDDKKIKYRITCYLKEDSINPLHYAAEIGSLEIVKEAISQEKQKNTLSLNINNKNSAGYTPLLIFLNELTPDLAENDYSNEKVRALRQAEETLDLLLLNGADVNATTDAGLTALEIAVNKFNLAQAADVSYQHERRFICTKLILKILKAQNNDKE